MAHVYHQTKFRWTENLTCRFIQLRKENGNLFTGRKYSAQAGWEFILQQMREEFPTIMSDVHYRVLKKKWSNLLQQYKELKNPVHGDRNKADDVSWPFYNAIGEFLGQNGGKQTGESINHDDIDPNEFLYVSVTPEDCMVAPGVNNEQISPPVESRLGIEYEISTLDSMERLRSVDNQSYSIERLPKRRNKDMGLSMITRYSSRSTSEAKRKHEERNVSGSRLSRFRQIPIGERINDSGRTENGDSQLRRTLQLRERGDEDNEEDDEEEGGEEEEEDEEQEQDSDKERPRKFRRKTQDSMFQDSHRLNRKLEEFFEYIKERDEENRSIMLRILHAVETIANKS